MKEIILGNKSKKPLSLDIQREYIRYHNIVDSHELPEDVLLIQSERLFLKKTGSDKKKKLLYMLAHSGTKQAYKLLLKYLKKPDKQLQKWVELCLQECAAHLGGELLDQEETFMVMSGAGGDGQRLRYYFIFSSAKSQRLTAAQKMVIKKSSKVTDKNLKGKTEGLYRILYPYFDSKFIFDSFSCRRNKGTHRAINRFREYSRKVSRNHTQTVWVLRCDIKKFFANIDHSVLINILKRQIEDEDVIWLLTRIIQSFHTKEKSKAGLPLGNLTSQLLVNVYMNEFDHYLKRELKIKYCARYADDFVILHESKKYLETILPKISVFLQSRLKLSLHPNKVFIKTLASGIDFLGWIHFPHHRIPRTSTKRRMFRKIKENHSDATMASYIGLLSHGDTYGLSKKIQDQSD
ncbi:reverse transcriptase/maturase family protein [Pedobacter sp.]|jgi:RNA-directed DNA polymerase|uniref:reverse transcriptase/maturase family protein n=1 Tax=Pedobacter sp. TaxID=1411316 RepID=UPI002CC8813F|nr:reverse transcriptase/maturase family protein [Pedobacter sp.]HWW42900.1 reverse transcriptase/maturase family protein [Pedobacter sp.]